MRRSGARPGAWRQEGRARTAADASDQHHFTPAALSVNKRGRVCIVAKVTTLDGEPVLAVAHRGQHGVDTTISLPVAAVSYAQKAGCRWLYFRRDSDGTMYRLPLADLPRLGHLGPGAGAEWYVAISKMQPTPWRRWEYAARIVRLDADAPEPTGRQLALGV